MIKFYYFISNKIYKNICFFFRYRRHTSLLFIFLFSWIFILTLVTLEFSIAVVNVKYFFTYALLSFHPYVQCRKYIDIFILFFFVHILVICMGLIGHCVKKNWTNESVINGLSFVFSLIQFLSFKCIKMRVFTRSVTCLEFNLVQLFPSDSSDSIKNIMPIL